MTRPSPAAAAERVQRSHDACMLCLHGGGLANALLAVFAPSSAAGVVWGMAALAPTVGLAVAMFVSWGVWGGCPFNILRDHVADPTGSPDPHGRYGRLVAASRRRGVAALVGGTLALFGGGTLLLWAVLDATAPPGRTVPAWPSLLVVALWGVEAVWLYRLAVRATAVDAPSPAVEAAPCPSRCRS